MLRTNK